MPPPGAVDSIAEILAIADAMERAAATQYARFGAYMRQVGHDDVAEVFEALAAEERQHVESVRQLAASASPVPAAAASGGGDARRWSQVATLKTEEVGAPALLTPYKALSAAVVAEEKAFTFWTYVASRTTSEPVRRQAETMARQELVHAAKLRRARRRAYHADPASRERARGAEGDQAFHARRAAAARLAAEAVDFLAAAALHLEAMADRESGALLREIGGALRNAERVDLPAGSADDGRISTLRRIEQSAAAGQAGILFDAAGRLEQLVEGYLDLLETSPDRRATEDLQRLGDQMVRSLARLNARLYAIEPGLADMTEDIGSPPGAAGAPRDRG